MSARVQKRLFTTHEYHRMAEAGILSEDDRLELIEGELVRMSPIGSRHAACVDRLTCLFSERAGRVFIVRVQNPISLGEQSEPEPDVSLLKHRADFYAEGHPQPSDILLLVEVVDSSAAYDREVKVPLYARAGIPEVWLVDLPSGVVEDHRGPRVAGYGEVIRKRRGERLAVLECPGLVLEVAELLG